MVVSPCLWELDISSPRSPCRRPRGEFSAGSGLFRASTVVMKPPASASFSLSQNPAENATDIHREVGTAGKRLAKKQHVGCGLESTPVFLTRAVAASKSDDSPLNPGTHPSLKKTGVA